MKGLEPERREGARQQRSNNPSTRPPEAPGDARGTTLLEITVALGLFLVLALWLVPDLVRWRARARLRGAIDALLLESQRLCAAARASGRSHGLAFELVQGDLLFQSVVDGDGDGIRRSDLRSGVDPPLAGAVRLGSLYPGVLPGIAAGAGPLPGGSAGQGGLALGPSRLLVCSADGSTSTGTVYLHVATGAGAAFRLYGATGRPGAWWWEEDGGGWVRAGS